jgi:hypothetical protein
MTLYTALARKPLAASWAPWVKMNLVCLWHGTYKILRQNWNLNFVLIQSIIIFTSCWWLACTNLQGTKEKRCLRVYAIEVSLDIKLIYGFGSPPLLLLTCQTSNHGGKQTCKSGQLCGCGQSFIVPLPGFTVLDFSWSWEGGDRTVYKVTQMIVIIRITADWQQTAPQLPLFFASFKRSEFKIRDTPSSQYGPVLLENFQHCRSSANVRDWKKKSSQFLFRAMHIQ